MKSQPLASGSIDLILLWENAWEVWIFTNNNWLDPVVIRRRRNTEANTSVGLPMNLPEKYDIGRSSRECLGKRQSARTGRLSLQVLTWKPISRSLPRGAPHVFLAAPIRAKGQVLGRSVFSRTRSKSSAWKKSFARNDRQPIGTAVDSARLPRSRKRRRSGGAPAVGARPARFGDPIPLPAHLAGRRLSQASPQGETGRSGWLVGRMSNSAHQAIKEMRLMLYELRPSASSKTSC